MKYKLNIVLLFCMIAMSGMARDKDTTAVAENATVTKTLTIADGDTLTESLKLPPDYMGKKTKAEMKLAYSEKNNTLTVIIDSKRNIFGLQTDARYSSVFARKIPLTKFQLMPDKLPYEVEKEPDNSFTLPKTERRKLGKDYKNVFLTAWVSSDDMTPLSASSAMVSKRMEQTFSVQPGKDKVTLTLGDLFVLDHKGSSKRSWKKFVIALYNNMNTQLEIEIRHDPCFGTAEALTAAQETLEQLRRDKAAIESEYPVSTKLPMSTYTVYSDKRNKLLRKYPMKEITMECQDIIDVWTSYNQVVDSLLSMKREIKMPAPTGDVVNGVSGNAKMIDAPALMFAARQLDELTSQWLLATDNGRRLTIRQQCEKILGDADRQTQGKRVVTDEQRDALRFFAQAVQYYRKTVRK